MSYLPDRLGYSFDYLNKKSVSGFIFYFQSVLKEDTYFVQEIRLTCKAGKKPLQAKGIIYLYEFVHKFHNFLLDKEIKFLNNFLDLKEDNVKGLVKKFLYEFLTQLNLSTLNLADQANLEEFVELVHFEYFRNKANKYVLISITRNAFSNNITSISFLDKKSHFVDLFPF